LEEYDSRACASNWTKSENVWSIAQDHEGRISGRGEFAQSVLL
jgi:hypothetical protein